MPIIGFKKQFKNIKSISDDIFTINFNLSYTETGSLKINDVDKNYFDVADFRMLVDRIFEKFNDDLFKKYDNGVYILSVCKYIVDEIPNLYSIVYESKDMIDVYYKNEIINDYDKIKYNNIINKKEI